MMWLGLIAGLVLGGMWKGFEGAIALGFIGWLTGLIFGARRKTEANDRIGTLELRLAAVEQELARLRTQGAATPARAEVTPIAQTTPIVEPTPVAQTQPTAESTPAFEEAGASPAAAHTPREPRTPAKPNPIIAWLTGGNAIARVGLVILFLGLAFLLKWAVDHAVLPPELRVGGVAMVGIALLAFGWRLRERRSGYALGLQGGGVAVLYLTTFAALRLYALVPPGLAFVLLAAIAVFSGVLAVTQNALVLAAFGAGGGFLAPILASTGHGSHVALFGYYLLLNLGIAGIALFRSWRSLNILGFLFTFVIGTLWGYRFYTPDYFASTEPFLVAFFLLYVAIAVVQAMRMEPEGKPYLDGILVFGTPIAAFSLQAALMRDTEYGLAFSCIAASALYLALAAMLRTRERVAMLFECFLALGVVFATLAIPLALDARWTSALWALEGAAVAWIGIRQQRRVATGFGLLMQLLAGGAFWIGYFGMHAGIPWIDAAFLGAIIVSCAGLWTSLVIRRSPWETVNKTAVAAAFAWGFAWLLFAAQHDIHREIAATYRPQAWVAFYAAIAPAFLVLSRRLAWKEAQWPSLALMPALAIFAAYALAQNDHAFKGWGAMAWGLAAVSHFWCVRRHEGHAPATWIDAEHIGVLLIAAGLMSWDLNDRVALETARHTAWSVAAVVLPPAAMLLAISARAFDARWPVRDHPDPYRRQLPMILALLFAGWVLFANVTHDGTSTPLPYLPFVNALDLAHLLVILALASGLLAARRSGFDEPVPRNAKVAFAALAFLWLNGVLLRTIHHWSGIPYRFDPMMGSMLVQAALSIFWTVLALALMFFATRRAMRAVWMTGAAFMAVVVAKLFLVDLSHVSGVERIVSFIVVGLLMLAVGYVAPVPPRGREARA